VSKSRPLPYLVWLDLEATGSDDPHLDPILEVAMVVSDHRFVEIVEYESVVDPSPYNWMERLERNAVVSKMHVDNGLVGDLLVGKGQSLALAEREMILKLTDIGKPHHFKLAGSGVSSFDRTWIRVQMSALDAWLQAPMYDTATIRAQLRDLCGRGDLLLPVPDKAHRALADVRTVMDEAKHYCDLFKKL
jgi:oligoribonuclease (3'-5' exoribonuclease)